MSSLLSLVGGGVKSIQHGTIALSAAGSETDTISSVDVDKSYVLHNGNVGSYSAYMVLTNTTTVTATSSGALTIAYTVVEHY